MRICIAILTCLVAVSCWEQEPARQVLSRIICTTEPNAVHKTDEKSEQPGQLFLVDGDLLMLTDTFEKADSEAKPFTWVVPEFEVKDTPQGQVIICGPIFTANNPAKDDEKPTYLTADYSCVPPAIKFTKQPEKYSYWKISADKKGPIVNISDFKRPASLGLDSQTIKIGGAPGHDGYAEFRKIILSLEPKLEFQVQKVDTLK
jgi:hypothetical protein